MKKSLLLFVLICGVFCFGGKAWAATYYVSSVSGDDTRSAATAQNPATPWAHHPRDVSATSNSAGTTLNAGDIVYMKKGEVWWNCEIQMTNSGTVGNPILTAATSTFGSGANPLCTGSRDTTGYNTGWTASSTSYYRTDIAT